MIQRSISGGNRCFQRRSFFVIEAQTDCQEANGGTLWPDLGSPFQIGDGADTETRALGQLLLRQRRRISILPQENSKSWTVHRGHAVSPLPGWYHPLRPSSRVKLISNQGISAGHRVGDSADNAWSTGRCGGRLDLITVDVQSSNPGTRTSTHTDTAQRKALMNPRWTLSTAAILLLLVSTAGPTLAAKRIPAATAHRATSVALVASYFGALDRQGRLGHDYRVLDRLYAPTITVLESLTSGHPRLHTGQQQVGTFDRYNSLSWTVQRTQQLSPSVVLTVEQPHVRGPGHELDRGTPWLTLFTIKSRKIVNLIWMSSSQGD